MSSAMDLNRLTTAVLLANYLINQVCCIGTFEVVIYSLSSSSSSTPSSSPCSSSSSERSFLFFRVCLSHLQQVRVSTDRCTYGEGVSSSVVFLRPSLSPPLTVNISIGFAWPGSYSVVIEAICSSSEEDVNATAAAASAPVNKTLVRMLSSGDLSPFDQWTNRSLRSGIDRLGCGLRFVCDENLYGANCSTYCRARDDALGHYVCNGVTGSRVCLDGWTDPDNYCVAAVCHGNCNHGNGTCVSPDKCSCFPGWSGSDCDSCIPAPGCSRDHGSCQLPGECSCDGGWGGDDCSQDLQFCTTNRPCVNGGICRNSEPGGFECQCLPGFTGANCQDVVLCPTPLGGTACIRDADDRYTCTCPSGSTDENCQSKIDTCQSNPCLNGGECVGASKEVQCLCAVGYIGHRCEEELDECRKRGRCIGPSEFLCLCLDQSENATNNNASDVTASSLALQLKRYAVVVSIGVLIPAVVIATAVVIWLVAWRLKRCLRRQRSSSSANYSTSVVEGDNIRNDLRSLNNQRTLYDATTNCACARLPKVTNTADDGDKVIAHAPKGSSSSSAERKKYSDSGFKQLNQTQKNKDSEKKNIKGTKDDDDDDDYTIYSIDRALERRKRRRRMVAVSGPYDPNHWQEEVSFVDWRSVGGCAEANGRWSSSSSSSGCIYSTPCSSPDRKSSTASRHPLGHYFTVV